MSKAQVFIDHLTIPVRDPEVGRRFYRQALAPFGVEEVELEGGVGWGPPGRVDFFIRQGEPTAPLHLAFAAPDRATVDAFHAAALDAGATDNGAPGLRLRYHPNYYAGYVMTSTDTTSRPFTIDSSRRGPTASIGWKNHAVAAPAVRPRK